MLSLWISIRTVPRRPERYMYILFVFVQKDNLFLHFYTLVRPNNISLFSRIYPPFFFGVTQSGPELSFVYGVSSPQYLQLNQFFLLSVHTLQNYVCLFPTVTCKPYLIQSLSNNVDLTFRSPVPLPRLSYRVVYDTGDITLSWQDTTGQSIPWRVPYWCNRPVGGSYLPLSTSLRHLSFYSYMLCDSFLSGLFRLILIFSYSNEQPSSDTRSPFTPPLS